MRAPTCLAILALSMSMACCTTDSARSRPQPDVATPLPPLTAGAHLPGDNKTRRKAWMEELHRAPPGVDWRAIEKANGRHLQERRNRLVTSAAAGSPDPWSEVGSSNQAGRIHVAALSLDGTALYAGSDLGGVWRGDLDGNGWTPLGDNLYGGAHRMVVLPGALPADPEVLVAAAMKGASLTDEAVSVSHDEGLTWLTPTGLEDIDAMRAVHRLQDASATVLILATTDDDLVLYASTDLGMSFVPRWSFGSKWDGGMWVPRVGPGAATDVYVVHDGRLYASGDGGLTFAPGGTLPASTAARLTGSEAGSPTLYVALQDGTWRLSRSLDAGASFGLVGPLAQYFDIWPSFEASIHDADLLVWGSIVCRRSADGGATSAQVNPWPEYYADPATKLHADIAGLFCVPHPTLPGQERWYICTDGGLYDSDDGVATVRNLSLSGLGVSQYYSVLTSRSDSSLILAGSQDQGYQRGAYLAPTGAGPSTPFDQLQPGDWGHLTSWDGSHDRVIASYPASLQIQEGQDSPSLSLLPLPPGAHQPWMAMVVADPLDIDTFYFCADRLIRYDHSGGSWSFQDHSTQDFSVGGGNYMTALAFAPLDPQRAYGVNDAGQLFVSTDHGVTWTNTTRGAPPEMSLYGNSLAVHPGDPFECVVGGSGYGSPGVLRTRDGGQTWSPLVDGLPETLIFDLAYAEDGSGDVYAAGESGAFRFDREEQAWVDVLGATAPLTIYWSVESVPDLGVMRFGTYGRGIWDLDLPATPIVDLGQALAGTAGAPGFSGTGDLEAGTPTTLVLAQGLPGALATLVIGVSRVDAPFKGGVLVPSPDILLPGLPLDGDGRLVLSFPMPPDLPPGVSTFWQVWFPDPGGPFGFAAGNALELVTP